MNPDKDEVSFFKIFKAQIFENTIDAIFRIDAYHVMSNYETKPADCDAGSQFGEKWKNNEVVN